MPMDLVFVLKWEKSVIRCILYLFHLSAFSRMDGDCGWVTNPKPWNSNSRRGLIAPCSSGKELLGLAVDRDQRIWVLQRLVLRVTLFENEMGIVEPKVTSKKSPNFNKSCPKIISLKWKILTLWHFWHFLNMWAIWAKTWLWKVAQSEINSPFWSHWIE